MCHNGLEEEYDLCFFHDLPRPNTTRGNCKVKLDSDHRYFLHN